MHHEGEYVCSVGDQECSCEVSVVELPPEFTKALSTVKTTCGEKAVFESEISKGDAKTKWFNYENNVKLNERVRNITEWRDKLDQCLRDLNLEISVQKDAKEACERALEAKVISGYSTKFNKKK